MREWLDQHRANITHFRSATGTDGTVSITVGFTRDDDHSEAFRRRFGVNGESIRSN